MSRSKSVSDDIILKLQGVHAYYGQSHVLHGLDLELREGEILALLGRNGAGRSSCLKAVMGIVEWRGEISYRGRSLSGMQTYQIARAGIGYVPENREIFADLSVEQNLMLGQKPSSRGSAKLPVWSMEEVVQLFPILQQRCSTKAGFLSGGEQQMLSLARSLMGNPDLLLIDEPTEGLAPQVIATLARCLLELKQRGVSILLVEQKLDLAMAVADRFVVLGHGRSVFVGAKQELQDAALMRQEWLEI